MSSNESPASNSIPRHGVALDVSFARRSDQTGESSSQVESRSSSGKRSSRSDNGESGTHEQAAAVSSNERRHYVSAKQPQDGMESLRPRKSGGFLLDSIFANGHITHLSKRGKRKVVNEHSQLDKGRHRVSRVSVDSSYGSSPLSREVSMDHGPSDSPRPQTPSRPASMDPAQLVQMALDLSESRRRHVSGGLQVPLVSPQGRRVVSGMSSGQAVVSQGDRSSHLGERTPNGSPSSNKSGMEVRNSDVATNGLLLDDQPQHFSPATLSRAEKARKYFELASEHRRLLEHLSPLKPDASPLGNSSSSTRRDLNITAPASSRESSRSKHRHGLGRTYNPLQALRNRRLRARERRPLTAPPEVWQETDVTANWIDEVEVASANVGFRQVENKIRLPVFARNDDARIENPDRVRGHRRTSTVGTVITRPENGWTVEPSELLADTYWTEKEDNKTLIEDRNGQRIFPSVARTSVDRPRNGGHALALTEYSTRGGSHTDEAPSDRRARGRVHLLPRRPRKLMRSRSVSTTSASSTEAHMAPPMATSGRDVDENIGPLDRHMQQMIEQEERGELSYQGLHSMSSDQDLWGTKHLPFPRSRDGPMTVRHRDTASQTKNGTAIEVPRQIRTRARSADGRVGSYSGGALLTEGDDHFGEPGPPKITGLVSSMDMDTSSSKQDQISPMQRKSKLRRLPFIRSQSKEQNKIESTDFADCQPRLSQESARHHRATESITGGALTRHDTTGTDVSTREPTSTVGRFFKGGRLGEMVRTETSRYRSRGQEGSSFDTADTHSSGMDDDGLENVSTRGEAVTTVYDDSDTSPRTSIDRGKLKQKYYLPNLPSFKSPSVRNKTAPESPKAVVNDDPLGRQQGTQKDTGRWTTRFGQLAPPRINTPGKDQLTPDSASNGLQYDPRRKSYGFLGTDSRAVSRNSLLSGGTTRSPDSEVDMASGAGVHNARSEGKRHWSISDQARPQRSSKVTARDVARVRALLLSSGVKAQAIQQQADSPRNTPVPYMQQIATLLQKDLGPIPRRQEHIIASRLLSDDIAATTSALQNSLDAFSTTTIRPLASRLDALQRRAADQLTSLVNETSDDADAFTVELTTKQPQDVKRIDDAIDDLLRRRRRQFRLLRRTGFKVLEWFVLGVMWGIWFMVMMFNLGRKSVVGVIKVLRWLVTF